uniref:WGS project CBME000000000 data, contig CS3487_c000719 n=1 Tax=Fusarium pseudograminearum CS3487 TaxID=1318458 RepID=A0A096PDJ1_FUSPS|nr:unnamed protein product [Fusarium pseudograminearum CS3487]
MARFEDLPLELFDSIVIKNDLPPESLAALRLCWPHIDDVVLPRLFRKLYVTFSERHLERLKNVTSSRLAPLVLELVFAVGTLQVYSGHTYNDEGFEEYSKVFRSEFFACVDALPNLRIFASKGGPRGIIHKDEEIDGLAHGIFPALCRPSSRITHLRCQGPFDHLRWLVSTFPCIQESPPMLKSFPKKYRSRKNFERRYRPASTRYRTPLGQHCCPYEWGNALRGLVKLDLQFNTKEHRFPGSNRPIANILVGFLEAAVNLEELCFRSGYEGLRMTYVGEQLGRVFDSKLKLPCLKTIKLAYVPLTASGRPFQEFIKRHAATMRHVLLCHIADKIPDVVRFAATSPEIQLHRFAVLPLQFRHRSADSLRTQAEYEHLLKLRLVPSPSPPVLIAEKSLLDYINSNNPNHQDPLVDALSSDDRWGTVDQKVDRSKWPEEMYFGCKECGDP